MRMLTRKDWTGYAVELMVVVLGILIAFQVEEWRDQMAEARQLNAALLRLKEETRTNLALCERDVPENAQLADALHVVLRSLNTGRLTETDKELFGQGLAKIAFNPQPMYLTTVAEEMIATGLLKDVEDPDLRTSIAELSEGLLTLRQGVANDDHLSTTADELNRIVEYSYAGPTELDAFIEFAAFEKGITVKYEFDELANNRYLKNLFIEATDFHTDRYRANYNLCQIFTRIDALLVATEMR